MTRVNNRTHVGRFGTQNRLDSACLHCQKVTNRAGQGAGEDVWRGKWGDRAGTGQQVTQLPDWTMIMIWSLSAACIDMRLLASWSLPFHVKASTKKLVNNSEPHEPAGARLEATWTVSRRGDGDAGWTPHWETHFYQNTAGGIVQSLQWVAWPGSRSSIPDRGKIFTFCPPWPDGLRDFISQDTKRLGREPDHWLPCSTEFKNAWSYTSISPYVFMVLCLIKHWSFIFTL
jgi:hypothetical protein